MEADHLSCWSVKPGPVPGTLRYQLADLRWSDGVHKEVAGEDLEFTVEAGFISDGHNATWSEPAVLGTSQRCSAPRTACTGEEAGRLSAGGGVPGRHRACSAVPDELLPGVFEVAHL